MRKVGNRRFNGWRTAWAQCIYRRNSDSSDDEPVRAECWAEQEHGGVSMRKTRCARNITVVFPPTNNFPCGPKHYYCNMEKYPCLSFQSF